MTRLRRWLRSLALGLVLLAILVPLCLVIAGGFLLLSFALGVVYGGP